MGRLLTVSPCLVCNYHVEDTLHFGGSSRSRLFIYFRYVLASCHNCHNIVSVLVTTPEYDLPYVLQAAADELAVLEERAEQDDVFARQLLPLHRAALVVDENEDTLAEAVKNASRCTTCGSADLTLFTHIGGDEGERFDEERAWIGCPRCEEGRLLIRTSGSWDEISDGT